MSSIKKQIKARIKAVLDPLKTTGPGKLREIEWKRSLFVLTATYPALHLVAGPEDRTEEDHLGNTMEFVVAFKIMTAHARDVEGECDDLVELVQDKIETDPQLNTLCNWMKYEGDEPFVNEVLKPEGGTTLFYKVQYRREKANADGNY